MKRGSDKILVLTIGALSLALFFAYQNQPPVSAAANGFNSRCTALGVVFCSGFEDSAADIEPYVSGDWNGNITAAKDDLDAGTGMGSLKFTVPSNSPENSSGSYDQILGRGFGPGDTLYVQFRQRFDSAMVNTPVMGGAGWKQLALLPEFGFYDGTDRMELGLYNAGLAKYAKLYNITGDTFANQTTVIYQTGQWMTFEVMVRIGTWGQPNSQVIVWAAPSGQLLTKIYDLRNVTLDQSPSDPTAMYKKITLTPFNAGKPDIVSHAAGHTWYDELIVSTNPIANPSGSMVDTEPPTVPSNLKTRLISYDIVGLNWDPGSDNVGVIGYTIYRNGIELAMATSTNYQDNTITLSTAYIYSVMARDVAGNTSDFSVQDVTRSPEPGYPPPRP